MATKLFIVVVSIIKFILFIKEIENLNKIIYSPHCIFSSISIFSVLVEFR